MHGKTLSYVGLVALLMAAAWPGAALARHGYGEGVIIGEPYYEYPPYYSYPYYAYPPSYPDYPPPYPAPDAYYTPQDQPPPPAPGDQYYRADNGDYCREFTRTVRISGQRQQAYGRACRQPDGSWRIVGE